MNKRIKELWENSDEIQIRWPTTGSPIHAHPELLEKFAELIVQECALQCVHNEDMDRIEKHFGVE